MTETDRKDNFLKMQKVQPGTEQIHLFQRRFLIRNGHILFFVEEKNLHRRGLISTTPCLGHYKFYGNDVCPTMLLLSYNISIRFAQHWPQEKYLCMH
jgi:hypothetical protein